MSELLSCPYNKEHRITQRKFIWHVSKCKKTHSRLQALECPYNSTHYIPPEEYDHHISKECAQRPSKEQADMIAYYNSKSKAAAENNFQPKNQARDKPKEEVKSQQQSSKPLGIETKRSGGGEGFTLNKLTLRRADVEEDKIKAEADRKKQEEEQKKKEDCEGQIF